MPEELWPPLCEVGVGGEYVCADETVGFIKSDGVIHAFCADHAWEAEGYNYDYDPS
jgi:hypothetical protein